MGGEGSEAALAGARNVPATCLGLHVRRASRIITQIYDAALEPAGKSAAAAAVCAVLRGLMLGAPTFGPIRTQKLDDSLRGIWFVGRNPPIW